MEKMNFENEMIDLGGTFMPVGEFSKLVRRLPSPYQEVFVVSYLLKMEDAMIARYWKLPMETVKQLQREAIGLLAEAMNARRM